MNRRTIKAKEYLKYSINVCIFFAINFNIGFASSVKRVLPTPYIWYDMIYDMKLYGMIYLTAIG